MQLKILSLNISTQKGTVKQSVPEINIVENGFENDAHAGLGHRQVSLMSIKNIREYEVKTGESLPHGSFGENITVEGDLILSQCKIFDRFMHKNVVLEVTQIGKTCHGNKCSIFRSTGDCVMPVHGIFCRVLKQGILKTEAEFQYVPKVFKVGIVTLSDRAKKGVYKDFSGPKLMDLSKQFFETNKYASELKYTLLADDQEALKNTIQELVDQNFDIIFTTGGTGIGPRDITPDVVKPMLHKEIPGIMELIRVKYGMVHSGALLSRSVAGVINQTLIYTLPGSLKAIQEYFDEISKTLFHSFYMVQGIDFHS